MTGDKVVSTYPDSWLPLTTPEELSYVDDSTLKVSKTDSFSSEGELVKFNIKAVSYTHLAALSVKLLPVEVGSA